MALTSNLTVSPSFTSQWPRDHVPCTLGWEARLGFDRCDPAPRWNMDELMKAWEAEVAVCTTPLAVIKELKDILADHGSDAEARNKLGGIAGERVFNMIRAEPQATRRQVWDEFTLAIAAPAPTASQMSQIGEGLSAKWVVKYVP